MRPLPPSRGFHTHKNKDKTEDIEGMEHTLVNEKQKKQENRRRRVKRTYAMYDKLPETKKIELKEGHIKFYRHCKYLGTWFSYNLCNGVDIHARIENANATMGKLKSF